MKKGSKTLKAIGLVFLAWVLLAWGGKGSVRINHRNNLPFGHPVAKSQLSCEQVLNLAKWGQKRFGGLGSKDLFNAQRARGTAEVFIEKLDPNRMLFLGSEVENFKKFSQGHWVELVASSKCEPWENWLEEIYPKIQARVEKSIQTFQAIKSVKQFSPTKSYSHFSSSTNELEKRWAEELNHILAETTPELLKAYQNSKQQLLKDRIEQKYFDVAPDPKNLLAKALLGGLDKYTTYFSPAEFEDFYEELKGTTAGLGLRLQKVPQGFLIEKIVNNSAAQKAHQLHENDIIEKVDDVQLASVSFEEAKELLKGPEKSLVKLGVTCFHGEPSGMFSDLTLERTQFELEETKIEFAWKTPKKSEEKVKKVAVISIPTFYGRGGMESGAEEKSVSEDFKQRLNQELLKDPSHEGLVLDLRGNPGGYLEEAVAVGSLFVGNKPIVGVLENGNTRVLKDLDNAQAIYNRPMVVLVDEGSASAAEVLTGALKDYHRAVVVGSSRTYGKGTVQKLFQLEDPFLLAASDKGGLGSGVIKLTTSVFYSPMGHTPANGGIETDIVLNEKQSKEEIKVATQDISPIVDLALRAEVENGLEKHQSEIEILKIKHKERLEQSVEEKKSTDKDLEEAIAIVSDMAHLELF